MSGDGPDAGRVLAGIFVILCGLCITLVGGGCTLFLLYIIVEGSSGSGDAGGYLLVSLAALAAGLALLWGGIRLLRGGGRVN